MFLAAAKIMAIVCSAVVIALPKGVFITTMPLLDAESKSILSTPIPALPMTFNLMALFKTTESSFVSDLIAIAS